MVSEYLAGIAGVLLLRLLSKGPHKGCVQLFVQWPACLQTLLLCARHKIRTTLHERAYSWHNMCAIGIVLVRLAQLHSRGTCVADAGAQARSRQSACQCFDSSPLNTMLLLSSMDKASEPVAVCYIYCLKRHMQPIDTVASSK